MGRLRFLSERRVSDSPVRDAHAGGGEGERAIKSLPEQPGMTHTTEFIREGGEGEGREAEGERGRESDVELTLKDNIWKQAKEEAVVGASHTNPSTRTKAVSGRKERYKVPSLIPHLCLLLHWLLF